MLSALVRATRADRLLVDHRAAWIAVLALVGIYFAAFFAFYPRTFTNTDEAQYVRQARVFLEGTSVVRKVDAFTGAVVEERPSEYPPGTAAYIAPFIWIGGPEAAYIAPCVALCVAVLLTALWIYGERRSPLAALLVLGFLPAMVLGRVPLSGLPSVALVALGLLLFFRGIDRGSLWWLASGFVAGASLVFRESNVLPFIPFYAGTVLRRERKCWALIVGGIAGVCVRLLGGYLVYGDPFFAKDGYGFMPSTIMDRVPYYAFGLLVLVPGGLIAGIAYRGRRWPELVATVCLFLFFYLTQMHTTSPSGFGRALIIALRYFVPLIPVLAFAMAEVAPRAWQALLEGRTREKRAALETVAAATLAAWIGGIAVASVGVHWASQRWSTAQAEIRAAIHEQAGDDSVLVTNWPATRKFLRRIDRRFLPIDRSGHEAADVSRLLERHEEVYIAFLDRSDTEYWRLDAAENEAFVAALTVPHALELDLAVTATDRLRVWRATRAPRSGP